MDLLYGDIEKLGKIFGQGRGGTKAGCRLEDQTGRYRPERVGEKRGTRVFLYDSGEDKPFTAASSPSPMR